MRVARGQSMLYAVLLLPTLILVFALAVELGSIQMQRLRLRWALDMATVDAATAIDAASYTRTGRLQLDQLGATTLTREYLYRNLSPLAPSLGGAQAALAIAQGAEIAVINQVPVRDPYSDAILDRPAVCARIRVLYRTDLLHVLPGLSSVVLTVAASAEIKN